MTVFYNQTALGECGHVVNTWPQFAGPNGKNPQVFCDTCAREQYGIPADDQFILVRLVEKKQSVRRSRAKPKPKPPKSRWQTLLEQEGLF